jgi:large subunit ribosomal protein L15
MNLHEVNKGIKKHKKRNRVGRGSGSGHGKTSDEAIRAKANWPGLDLHRLSKAARCRCIAAFRSAVSTNRFAVRFVP